MNVLIQDNLLDVVKELKSEHNLSSYEIAKTLSFNMQTIDFIVSYIDKDDEKDVFTEKYINSINDTSVYRDQLADNLSKNRYINGGIPSLEVEIYGTKTVKIDEDKYSDLLESYKEAKENADRNDGDKHLYEKKLAELDTMLAERLTLDNDFAIEYDSLEQYILSFNSLNSMSEYNGKLDTYIDEKTGSFYIFLNKSKNTIDRDQLAENLSENRYIRGGLPSGELETYLGNNIEIDEDKYSDLLESYKEAKENADRNDGDKHLYEKKLAELDTMLAERISLDNDSVIELISEEEYNISMESLSKLDQYKGKLDSLKDEKTGKYYIFKK